MKQSNIDFLNANRHHYEMWVKAQIVNHLDQATRQRMLDVIRDEWDGRYLANLWCSPCVVSMLVYAYTQYDKWLLQQNVQ
jgi:hypothetical protein